MRVFDSIALNDLKVWKGDLTAKDENGWTPLHFAFAYNSDLEVIKYLIENKKVNLEAKNNEGQTPLHFAFANNNLEVIQHVIEKKVNLDDKDNKGLTPLHHAFVDNNLEVIKYLIENKKVNLEAKNNEGQTLLHFAFANNNPEVKQYLIENKKFNLDAKDNKGQTPLHHASQYNNESAIEVIEKEPIEQKLLEQERTKSLLYLLGSTAIIATVLITYHFKPELFKKVGEVVRNYISNIKELIYL